MIGNKLIFFANVAIFALCVGHTVFGEKLLYAEYAGAIAKTTCMGIKQGSFATPFHYALSALTIGRETIFCAWSYTKDYAPILSPAGQ
jgi:hypothetical protein